MATRNWTGNAAALKDTWTITVANTWATADTATMSINGKDLVVTIGTLVTTAQVATTIKEAWNATTFTDTSASKSPSGGGASIPEMAEYTASVSGSVVTLTATTAGVPGMTLTVTESTAGSGTATGAHSVTGTGPNDWANVDNWAEGSVPVSTDDVVIDRPVAIQYGLAQSAVTLTSLTITSRFTAAIGLLRRNANGYEEGRATELAIGATTFTSAGASTMLKVNFGSVQTAATVSASGTSTETGRPAVQLRGTHASNTLTVTGGDVGWGASDETAVVLTVDHNTGGTLTLGKNVTATTVDTVGGTIKCGATTLRHNAGTLTVSGSGTFTTLNSEAGTLAYSAGAVTTLNCNGSSATYRSAGTITTANVNYGTFAHKSAATVTTLTISNGATANFDGTSVGCTVTNTTINRGILVDSANRITFTNGPAWSGTLTVEPTE